MWSWNLERVGGPGAGGGKRRGTNNKFCMKFSKKISEQILNIEKKKKISMVMNIVGFIWDISKNHFSCIMEQDDRSYLDKLIEIIWVRECRNECRIIWCTIPSYLLDQNQ